MSLYIGDTPVKLNVGGKVYKITTPPPVTYVTFSSPNELSISVTAPGWDGVMQYSTDTKSWRIWDGSAISGTEVYVRGVGNTQVTGDSDNLWILTGSDIACVGNIENLLDYTTVANGEHPIMADSCYRYMFSSCTSLTTAPELPATTLADSCYNYMFNNCTGLTTAPELPATTLADSCYYYMFNKCTSLTTAPALPATTLASHCYYVMFNKCTSLTTAPALPATTLAYGCYSGMFSGCTGIKLSETKTDEYTQAYRIPTTGEITSTTYSLNRMFGSTGGTFTGTPTINTTYYLHSSNTIV